jgi:aspartokinase-like uncharacterized kinase
MKPAPLVVKLGGSLQHAELLPAWLALLAQHGGGRVVVVPGGGRFTDEARAAQARWRCDDLHAHNMAVLGMAQMAQLFHALQPRLQLAGSSARMREVLGDGGVALWQPLDLLREAADELTNWNTTSDSLSAWLALQLGARRLWLVKACAVPATLGVQELADQGIVDPALPLHMQRWGGELRVLHVDSLEPARRWLDGPAPDDA